MAREDGIRALADGRAFVELSGWRKIGVSGGDALSWLNDLLAADIAGLVPGRAQESVLLSPTGHVRADVTASIAADGTALLLQDPVQPRAIGDLLAPYVLSSDVELTDRTGDVTVVAFPGRDDPPSVPGAAPSAPSGLKAGSDLLVATAAREDVLAELRGSFEAASPDDAVAWRIAAGMPRFGVDGTEADLPQECGLDGAVAFGKGCYLGQEAMAKVRNLGHPRRVLVSVEANADVRAGDAVEVAGRVTGRITSASVLDGRAVALAVVGWDARGGPFRTSSGVELRARTPSLSRS